MKSRDIAKTRDIETVDKATGCNHIEVTMKTRLIQIGNSKGVRIPKPVIDQCQLEGELQVEVRGRELVIYSPKRAREGWAEAFEEMAAHGEDQILETPASSWDDSEWEWK